MRYLAFILILLGFTIQSYAQSEHDNEPVDIDEWQVMKAEASKDPFAKSNQFTINFANYTAEEWCYPLAGAKVISGYGGNRHHAGSDIKTKPNDTIRAAFPGLVVMSGPYYGYGNFIVIRHANGLETAYSHQSKNFVKKGAWVQAGQPIGLTGRTGRATTAHLHFETRVNGKPFDSSKIYDHIHHTIKKEVFVVRKKGNGFTISIENKK